MRSDVIKHCTKKKFGCFFPSCGFYLRIFFCYSSIMYCLNFLFFFGKNFVASPRHFGYWQPLLAARCCLILSMFSYLVLYLAFGLFGKISNKGRGENGNDHEKYLLVAAHGQQCVSPADPTIEQALLRFPECQIYINANQVLCICPIPISLFLDNIHTSNWISSTTLGWPSCGKHLKTTSFPTWFPRSCEFWARRLMRKIIYQEHVPIMVFNTSAHLFSALAHRMVRIQSFLRFISYSRFRIS